LSRRTGTNCRVGDVATGEGISQAARDCDAIIHAASNPRGKAKARSTDIDGTRLLAALGIPVIYVSIVGVDRSPYSYYRTKLAGEQELIGSGTPWSVLRATQFHEFIDMLLSMSRAAGARLPWRTERSAPVYFPKDWRLGPVAADDVAGYLADMIDRGPTFQIEQFGGPQQLTSSQLAMRWVAARGGHFKRLPTAGRIAAAFKAGVTVPENPDAVGSMTWDEYLAKSSA
jgi:uncharacterized protein YbjT (DUF2867 family)